MKKPTLLTYQSWLVDYWDGNLNKEQVILLHKFVLENPILKESFELMHKQNEILNIDYESITFPHKEDLLKTKKHQTLKHEQLVGLFEKDLNYDSFTNEELNHEANQAYLVKLEKSVLKVDDTISYPHKERLLKKAPPFLFRKKEMYWASIAAILLITSFLIKWHKPDILYKRSTENPIESNNTFNTTIENPIVTLPLNTKNLHSENSTLSLNNLPTNKTQSLSKTPEVLSPSLAFINEIKPLPNQLEVPKYDPEKLIHLIDKHTIQTLVNNQNIDKTEVEKQDRNKTQLINLAINLANKLPGFHYNNQSTNYQFTLQIGSLSIKAN